MKKTEKKAKSGRPPHVRCAKCGTMIEVVLPSATSGESAGDREAARETKVKCPKCGHETLILFKSNSPEVPGKRQPKMGS